MRQPDQAFIARSGFVLDQPNSRVEQLVKEFEMIESMKRLQNFMGALLWIVLVFAHPVWVCVFLFVVGPLRLA